jgi:exonuclease VII small subunit
MSWGAWMVVEQTLETELSLEKAVREIENAEDVEQIKRLCVSLTRQNWHYRQMMKQAVMHVAELETSAALLD